MSNFEKTLHSHKKLVRKNYLNTVQKVSKNEVKNAIGIVENYHNFDKENRIKGGSLFREAIKTIRKFVDES